MPKDVAVEGTRDLRTYVVLYYAADDLVRKTERITEGSDYTAMSALILTAFTFEAYLNHLGEAKLDFWSKIESAKVMGKYAVLCDHFDVHADFSRRPYQTLRDLLRFRNALAHGKSQRLETRQLLDRTRDLIGYTIQADWEEYCCLKNAKRAIADVAKAIRELHGAAGLRERPFEHGLKRFWLRYVGGAAQTMIFDVCGLFDGSPWAQQPAIIPGLAHL